ncbi:hypothetical protein GLAREA_08863 [Glarea lozoyensis ATCC 20868]|uniref:FAR-17a/AIG1-like protein n=1 Tax=Glarea lozoyensis (strain ATCC 20868 / MF5171) TaxID=1116229 RepID=S3DG63_GLAL2|nr:uncharacterized protein GLAREA_08863 [Glarea lozoyensis ATCC 20868]EPE36700.1 hypothetical protein GLAREA_08863 [Glarea lozoyensis ATCC 20868]
MSSSTALLPKDRKKTDHPIFLRITHSPWVIIDQKTLVSLQFIVSVYLTGSLILIANYDVEQNQIGWSTVFNFSNIAYFMQALYSWIAFSWTFMHLHYPHHDTQPRSFSTRLQAMFSPPRQNQTTHNRAWFSIFYYAVNSFPFLAAGVQWLVLIPNNQSVVPGNEIFGNGRFREFYFVSKYAVNSLIALMEITMFSSIKRADALWAHIFGITALSLLYTGWAYVGNAVTGRFEYYFLDPEVEGWDNASASIMAFAGAANFALFIAYVLTAIRERLSTTREERTGGYESLPR